MTYPYLLAGILAASSGYMVSVQTSDTCTALAFIYHESSFNPHARNPGSSAKGYPQALDGTWADYQRERGEHRSRSNLWDSIDFVNWYNAKSRELLDVYSRWDLYLAYHYGWRGYSEGSFTLQAMSTAKRIALSDCWELSKVAFAHLTEDA